MMFLGSVLRACGGDSRRCLRNMRLCNLRGPPSNDQRPVLNAGMPKGGSR